MSRSASVSVPRRELYVVPERRASLELEDAPRHLHLDQPREFESWPCDSFFLLPDAVLAMDAGAFRADLMSLDPALSASLPDWDLPGLTGRSASPSQELAHHTHSQGSHLAHHRPDRRSLTLLDHHLGLTVHTAGHGTVLIGGGGDGRESSGGAGAGAASANGHSSQQSQQPQQQQPQQQQQEHQSQSAATKRSPAQKGQVSFSLTTNDIDIGEGGVEGGSRDPPVAAAGAADGTSSHGLPPLPRGHKDRWSCSLDTTDSYWFAQDDNTPPGKQHRASLAGPNDLIFGEDDKSSGLSYKDREERLRQLRERQQLEKQQKLEELKEQAAAAQRFREQQENERRRRLEEMRLRDADRRSQVEERKRIIQQAEQDRREAVIRKNAVEYHQMKLGPHKPFTIDNENKTLVMQEREHRLESKRRNERSNIVFAFGSSTPRMLDPKDNSTNASYWSSRRATSTTNVHLVDASITRRASECSDMDLSRKRATSAQSLDRKPEDLRMSSSMYEVFHWDESSSSHQNHPPTTQGTRLTKSRDSSLERKTPPTALTWVRSSTPQPIKSSSLPLSSKETPIHPSSTSSSSSDKTPTNTSQSRFCVWEFGDNFTALGPANQNSGGSGNPASSSPASTPTSSTCYSRRTASVFTGAGCTIGGEDLMTRSMTAAIPASAARRRTDLIPAMPSLRDSTGANRSSPRHRSPVSVGATPSTTKPLRAKSAGSDRSTPATPARTPVKTSTPKKTPSQVKAESAAKKAIEKSKTTPKSKPSPKTPLQSPAVENKSLPGVKEDKKKAKEDKNLEIKSDELNDITEDSNINESVGETPPREKMNGADLQLEAVVADVQVQPEKDAGAKIEHPSEDLQAQDKSPVAAPVSETKQLIEDSVKSVEPSIKEKEVLEVSADTPSIPVEDKNVVDESPDKVLPEENLSSSVIEESLDKPVEDNSGDQDKTLAQKAAEKPVTGYATEEEYKAALAEKRRLAREAKERELELERQRQLEEEERERKEEEEFLKMIAEQKKAEEERLRKAIEEADRNRIEEAKRKEEEEKQREEAERLENQKRLETEERLRREEEERQARKSRVAAIMARTRGKGGSNTPTKAEAKTPSDEAKNFGDGEMTTSMTDSMISLVTASEMQSEPKIDSQPVISTPDTPAQLISDVASHHSSDVLPKPSGDSYAPPTSDVSIKTVHDVDMASQSHTTEIVVDSKSSVEQKVMHSNIEVTSTTENYQVDDLISGMSSVKVEEPHVNGDSPVPMDTTPTQSVDLLGSLSDVHSVNHNGVDNTPPHTTQGTDNLLGSLDPLDSSLMSTTTITPAASNFEQIIDLGQTKLSNEDAVNSNPPSPFIAFEQNLNKKQNQENTSTVPDLLL
ncbi:MAP7 domain-containing protein 1 isoform X7 [Procambarus clarkii]|uniref:MAP7 domain-containing protein 1 isoform X7 n=1 Tax=Procambarus clarkii TaxID=6728 RepID=UPI003743094E